MIIQEKGKKADFISDKLIANLLEQGQEKSREELLKLVEKGREGQGLTAQEVAALLSVKDPEIEQKMHEAAAHVKTAIYGNRMVIFAPLYVSNYCINSCRYCGYKAGNEIRRKKLNDDELRQEVQIIQRLGHKRIVLEAGEDEKNCPIEYILHAMDVIYNTSVDNGSIRRINVNIAATTVENYRKLKEAGIGTYILFQETYHRDTYAAMHTSGPKSDYEYHTTAMDRAMEAGLDDVGIGVLLGLYDYQYEMVATMLHKEHMEKEFGVGPHTISVPRIKAAKDVSLEEYPYIVTDAEFKRIVSILRIAVPYTGIIVSTREESSFRDEVIKLGASQISAGSCTGVGGYKDHEQGEDSPQFEVADHRSPNNIIKSLCRQGHLPSYCTACYRMERTGDRFMQLAKNGSIHDLCYPNAILTFKEYLEDYADEELKELGEKVIEENLQKIPKEKMKLQTIRRLKDIESGKRDFYF